MLTRFKGKKRLQSALLLSGFTAVIAVAALSHQQSDQLSASSACVCQDGANYNTSLPASHPNNRCAVKDDLSWKSWLTGNNSSTQFHFVDLLELLYGHNEQPLEDMSPTSSHINN